MVLFYSLDRKELNLLNSHNMRVSTVKYRISILRVLKLNYPFKKVYSVLVYVK